MTASRFHFRAWDKKDNRYDSWIDILMEDGRCGWQDSDGAFYDCTERAIVEMSTGLCDKNGKEIFEGDIFSYLDDYKALVTWDDRQLAWICKLPDGKFWPLFQYAGRAIEVVGNQWENPELLK